MDATKIVCEHANWIELAHNRLKWRTFETIP